MLASGFQTFGNDYDIHHPNEEITVKLKRPDNAQFVITHYQRLLNYIIPDYVHVLFDGRVVKSGGKELALELEERGYESLVRHELQPA